jgi:hypothetical protein
MKFHLLYTTKDHKFIDEEKEFDSFTEVEIWLVNIEAINWEIGIPDEYFKKHNRNETQTKVSI